MEGRERIVRAVLKKLVRPSGTSLISKTRLIKEMQARHSLSFYCLWKLLTCSSHLRIGACKRVGIWSLTIGAGKTSWWSLHHCTLSIDICPIIPMGSKNLVSMWCTWTAMSCKLVMVALSAEKQMSVFRGNSLTIVVGFDWFTVFGRIVRRISESCGVMRRSGTSSDSLTWWSGWSCTPTSAMGTTSTTL